MKQKNHSSHQPDSMWKILLFCVMILSGGFTLIGYFQKDPFWMAYLAVFCVSFCICFVKYRKQPEKLPDVQSVLSDEQLEHIQNESSPLPGIFAAGQRPVYWTDQMRLDFYNSKPHTMALTKKSLLCADEDFCFEHPIENIVAKAEKNGRIVLYVTNSSTGKQRKEAFVCASPQAFMQAFSRLKK